MATVTAISRYPVKSMGGEALTTCTLTQHGVPGDRAWAVKDEERGGIRGGKRFPELMQCSARFLEEPTEAMRSAPAEITCPDGTVVRAGDDAAAKLSELVGSPLSMWPLLPAEQTEHYLRGAPEPGLDVETYLRQVFARTEDEPIPDVSQFPPELATYESPPGTYFDAYPLLIIGEASLAALQTSNPESQFDLRRFRANIVVNGIEAFEEESWSGQTATLGTAELKLELACPRCVMTTHGFADLPKDPKIMRTLVRENDGNLGIYASVTKPGTVKLGDQLTLS